MSLPSQILNVLPGGKYHEIALAVRDGAELQYSFVCVGRFEWKEPASADKMHFADSCFGIDMEWRIKPKPQRYRVAKLKSFGEIYVATITEEHAKAELERQPHFLEWLTDWIEYDV